LFHSELYPLALLEVAETLAADRAVVHEYIGRTFALDESVPLSAVEPLDRSD